MKIRLHTRCGCERVMDIAEPWSPRLCVPMLTPLEPIRLDAEPNPASVAYEITSREFARARHLNRDDAKAFLEVA